MPFIFYLLGLNSILCLYTGQLSLRQVKAETSSVPVLSKVAKAPG